MKFLVLLFIHYSLFTIHHSAAASQQPNVILFLIDDMGLMDTSVPFIVDAKGQPVKHSLNGFYRTPNMERLAAAGTRFT
jgi:arylsulfatase A-like enzyme